MGDPIQNAPEYPMTMGPPPSKTFGNDYTIYLPMHLRNIHLGKGSPLRVDIIDLRQGLPKTKLIRIIREIAKYADFHFVSEENIMADCNYPDLEQHAALHRRLLNQVQDYTNQFSIDEIEAPKIFEFLFS